MRPKSLPPHRCSTWRLQGGYSLGNLQIALHTRALSINRDQHMTLKTNNKSAMLTQLSKFVIHKDSVKFTTFKCGKIVLVSRHLGDKLNQSLAVYQNIRYF